MADIIKWPVVLVTPGDHELSLLAELSARRDSRIVAVLDPTRESLGAGLAEIMGLPVIASLAELTAGAARYLVHPPLDEVVASLVDQAAAAGLESHLARDFAEMVSGPRLAGYPGDATDTDLDEALSGLDRATDRHSATADLEFLEMETAAIHRTLSRIEEALDREALLRWLLGLATRATGATSGSIMLLDREADELYVAFAYGLSQNTLHRTRVRLGDGVAGRVARSRRAELIATPQVPGALRDRGDLQSAICAPILWDGQVLGVINVCTADGEPELDRDALNTLDSLTHRFGLILDRFVHIQSSGDRLLLREMEERFTRDTGLPETLASTLCAWAGDVRDVSGADEVTLDILTSDGDLFSAAPGGTHYEAPPDAMKAEVLSRGRPRVIRPGDSVDPSGTLTDNGATVFHLPIGRDPLRALLSLYFSSAAKAHHFHAVSSEILLLLNRHLTGFLDRAATADQLDRLTTLAAALSELGAAPAGQGTSDRVLAAARRLTGATTAMLLTGEEMLAPEPGVPQTPEQDLRREAARLLNDAGRSGWQTTVLETTLGDVDATTRSLLAVPLGGNDPFPGLVLLDKRRLHPLDGSSFTEFDALFARRLLPLLAERLRRRPELDDAEAEALADRLQPAPPDLKTTVLAAAATRGALAEILRREMDRCDRYHTMLGLAAFRPAPREARRIDPAGLVAGIGRHLRSSDHCGCLEDGTVLIIVPEDIQSLPRLVKRVCELMRHLADEPSLDVRCASRVYPGAGDSPEKLIQSVLTALT